MNSTNMFSIFADFPDLLVVISDKSDGPMKLQGDGKFIQGVIKNRNKFFKKLNITNNAVVSAGLVHGNQVKMVSKSDVRKFIQGTDALITEEKNLFLSITIADCLPIFIYDPIKEVVSLVHGGWRSLAGGIISYTLKGFERRGIDPRNLLVGIGPGIGRCHFEFKEDVLSKFGEYDDAIKKHSGKNFIDLKKVAQMQLVAEGVKKEHIEINPLCTYCESEKYFSNRRDKSVPLKTMVAVIGTKRLTS